MRIGGFQPCTFADFPGHLAAIVFTTGCNLRCGYCHNPELLGGGGTTTPAEQILARLQQRAGKLTGVVLTGGEALLQPDVLDFARACRAMGYAIKLDSNGCHPTALQQALDSGCIDYLALDVKDLPGASTLAPARVSESIAITLASGVAHEFRTTAVASLHDHQRLCSIADLLVGGQQWWLQRVQAGTCLDPGFPAVPPNLACLQAAVSHARKLGIKSDIR